MVKAKKLIVSALACMAALAMTATAIAADFTPQDAKERAEETKSYLSAMNVKGSGMDEWGLIGLSASNVSGDSDTVKEIINTALTDISTNGFSGSGGAYGESAWGSNAGALAKLILFLNSQGISPYTFGKNGDFEGYDLVATLFNTDHYYQIVSAYDVPYALMVYDALGISPSEEAGYKYSREDLVQKCIGLIGTVNAASSGIPGGTDGMTGVANLYDTTGKAPYDLESTAMILQALAPYYTDTSAGTINSSVKSEVTTKVDGCVASIKQLQTETGGIPYAFFTYGSDWSAQFDQYADSCDAMAQIILAFTALGIDIDTVIHSNGTSMLDNFLSSEYQTSVSGEFRANSTLGASYSTYYTTKFAYLALVSYNGLQENGGDPYSVFNRTTPVAYTPYDYSFFYQTGDNNEDDTTSSQPEDKPVSDTKDPVKTGDAFPAEGIAFLAIASGLALLLVKKARTSD